MTGRDNHLTDHVAEAIAWELDVLKTQLNALCDLLADNVPPTLLAALLVDLERISAKIEKHRDKLTKAQAKKGPTP